VAAPNSVGATYVGSRISQVRLMCLDAKGVDATAWSLENEKLRKTAHDALIAEWCSKGSVLENSLSSLVYKFSWGKVSSILDIKGMQALILVEYE
jgi:hypothetical protein